MDVDADQAVPSPAAEPAPRRLGSPGAISCTTGLIAFVLALIGALLTVPSGYGLEDFLGWGRTGADSPADALAGLWRHSGMQWLAQLDLALDTLAFVPCYAALLGMFAHTLSQALSRDRLSHAPPDAQAVPGWHPLLLATPLAALVLIDQAENVLGSLRLPTPWGWAVWLAAAGAGFLVLAATGSLRLIARHWPARAWLGGAALALLTLYAAGVRQVGLCAPADTKGWTWLLQWDVNTYGCAAHHGKQALMGVVALAFVVAGLLWLFGALIRKGEGEDKASAARNPRARLRSAIGDMLLRCRYVLIALLLLVVFYLVMDQARDVLYAALAVDDLGAIASHAAVVLAGIAAVWCMAFSGWLWTRSVCQIVQPMVAQRGDQDAPDPADSFALGLARVLGMAPLLIAGALSILVCGDAVKGYYQQTLLETLARAPARAGWVTLAAAGLSLLYAGLALLFIRNRSRQIPPADGHYYNCRIRPSWLPDKSAVKTAPQPKYLMAPGVTPGRLFTLALWGFFLMRVAQLFEGVPSLAQAGIALMLAFWLCVFGWFSLLEVQRAVPWVLMLIVAAGALGLVAGNGHHGVWAPLAQPTLAVGSGLGMLLAAAVLALLLQGLYQLAMWRVEHRAAAKRWPLWAWPVIVAGVVGLATGAMSVADHQLSARAVLKLPQTTPADPRQTLDAAMAGWLSQLCETEADGCRTPVPVYFIATAGGGVRAAAWTASILQQWQHQDPRFGARTFAISGVSGGSVGAAVFKACLGANPADAPMQACIDRYLQADLLSPLLSAWMFEDVLGSLLPERVCARQPGCGFLSRAAWFEAALERAVPALRHTLAGSAGTPHLLLNASWVETGERAIASDIRLGTDFPGAKDQLDLLAWRDLPLSTAAHNSARFPYTNAIGELNGTLADCANRPAVATVAASVASAPGAAGSVRIEPPLKPCGHLADGGYYDNSGMASLGDALAGLRRCLLDDPSMPLCRAALAKTAGLREQLRVKVLMLRNQPRLSDEPLPTQCPPSSGLPKPATVVAQPPKACQASDYRPGRPDCKPSQHFFIDEIGPPLTVLMTSGIGAHGLRDEALMQRAATELLPVKAEVFAVDLLQRNVHYPLGWHLSEAAVTDVREQAAACKLATLQSPASAPIF